MLSSYSSLSRLKSLYSLVWGHKENLLEYTGCCPNTYTHHTGRSCGYYSVLKVVNKKEEAKWCSEQSKWPIGKVITAMMFIRAIWAVLKTVTSPNQAYTFSVRASVLIWFTFSSWTLNWVCFWFFYNFSWAIIKLPHLRSSDLSEQS